MWKKTLKDICKTLKTHAERTIYWNEKDIIPLTNEQNKSYENQKRCRVCRKRFTKDN